MGDVNSASPIILSIRKDNIYMKRVLAALLCAGLIMIFTSGCFGAPQVNPEDVATGDEASSLNAADYKNDFEGLCNYFAAYGYINPKDPTKTSEMDASLIGAKVGKKFTAVRIDDVDVKNITIELYEYKTDNLNATADEVIGSVKSNGTFTILELPEVKATISDNGKYLMIYNDKGLDETKTDSDNYKWREEVLEKFKSFHK